MNHKNLIPHLLTFSRFFLSLTLLPFLLLSYLPTDSWTTTTVIAAFFATLSFTDFLDGYYARRWNITSQLGAVADHFTDKVLVTSTLITLVSLHKIYCLWAIIFIVRELCVMGLREYGLLCGITVSVNFGGKLKAFLQYLYLFLVILISEPSNNQSIFVSFLLTIALIVSVGSAVWYGFELSKRINALDNC